MSESSLLPALRAIDPYDFEQFVADLWERQGWTTEVVQQSRDGGIDVIATKDSPVPRKELIQAKRNAEDNTVSAPEIQQYASLRHQQNDADSVVVVTTSSFTADARQRASDLNVKLVDGATLVKMISDTDAEDLVETYIDDEVTEEQDQTEIEASPQMTEPRVVEQSASPSSSGSVTSSAAAAGGTAVGAMGFVIDNIEELLQATVVLYITYKFVDILVFDDTLPDLLLNLI